MGITYTSCKRYRLKVYVKTQWDGSIYHVGTNPDETIAQVVANALGWYFVDDEYLRNNGVNWNTEAKRYADWFRTVSQCGIMEGDFLRIEDRRDRHEFEEQRRHEAENGEDGDDSDLVTISLNSPRGHEPLAPERKAKYSTTIGEEKTSAYNTTRGVTRGIGKGLRASSVYTATRNGRQQLLYQVGGVSALRGRAIGGERLSQRSKRRDAKSTRVKKLSRTGASSSHAHARHGGRGKAATHGKGTPRGKVTHGKGTHTRGKASPQKRAKRPSIGRKRSKQYAPLSTTSSALTAATTTGTGRNHHKRGDGHEIKYAAENSDERAIDIPNEGEVAERVDALADFETDSAAASDGNNSDGGSSSEFVSMSSGDESERDDKPVLARYADAEARRGSATLEMTQTTRN